MGEREVAESSFRMVEYQRGTRLLPEMLARPNKVKQMERSSIPTDHRVLPVVDGFSRFRIGEGIRASAGSRSLLEHGNGDALQGKFDSGGESGEAGTDDRYSVHSAAVREYFNLWLSQ